MKELISVIVPCYNVEKYIKKCIDSILSQTYTNLEIILVNDGSTDSCGKICNSYARIDERIKVIHKENGGLSDARNAGIKKATGEYITFVDSDDYLETNCIEILMKSINRNNSDIAIAGHKTIYPGKIYTHVANHEYCDRSKEILYKLLYDKGIDTSAWSKLYKVRLFDNIKYPKGRLFEDAATTYKLIDSADKISVVPKPVYNYIIRKNSISNESFSEKKMDLIISTQEMTDYIKNKYPDLSDACERRLMFAYLSTLSQLAKSSHRDIKNQKLLMRYIQENRRRVLRDPEIPRRDRIALFTTKFGFKIFKYTWNVYAKLTSR